MYLPFKIEPSERLPEYIPSKYMPRMVMSYFFSCVWWRCTVSNALSISGKAKRVQRERKRGQLRKSSVWGNNRNFPLPSWKCKNLEAVLKMSCQERRGELLFCPASVDHFLNKNAYSLAVLRTWNVRDTLPTKGRMPFDDTWKRYFERERNISVLRGADTQTPLCGFMSEVNHDLW